MRPRRQGNVSSRSRSKPYEGHARVSKPQQNVRNSFGLAPELFLPTKRLITLQSHNPPRNRLRLCNVGKDRRARKKAARCILPFTVFLRFGVSPSILTSSRLECSPFLAFLTFALHPTESLAKHFAPAFQTYRQKAYNYRVFQC